MLVVPYEAENGEKIERFKGVPQDSVIGQVEANLFLHYVFDECMARNHRHIPFERYTDYKICHCRSEHEMERQKGIMKEGLLV